ncbi:MAG TPA: ABC transporter ATP-binding protein [Nitrososphaerales archaeon]|nr:ABC transporter ATP-binding protein [Nitrososphaerales archaeon]
MDELVRFDGAAKDYGTKTIGPLSFSVARGSIVGFLGPNGAGKSTSIRLMLGLMRPSYGEVRLRGLDPVKHHSRALQEVGYSPELPNLQTFLSPVELLTLVGKELSIDAHELKERIPRLLETIGIAAYSDTKIGKLSKGMVQRLSVAQALLGSPSLLILDEPMIGIDPAGVVHFRELFRGFVSGGGTIVMSSHIMSEVESLCSSVMLIHSGRIVSKGTIKDFIESSLGGRTVRVELGPHDDSLLGKIRAIAGVLRVGASEGGLDVAVEKGRDLRGEISKEVVGSGVDLLSIGFSRSEFDDAYVSATRSEVD